MIPPLAPLPVGDRCRAGPSGDPCQSHVSTLINHHAPDGAAGRPNGYGIGRDGSIHERARPNHGMVANDHPLSDDGLAADVATIADFHGRALIGGFPARDGPFDGIMGINLDTGADTAIIADLESARPVEQRIGTNPSVRAYADAAIEITGVVQARTLAKSEAARALPAIEQQLRKGQVALPGLAHRLA